MWPYWGLFIVFAWPAIAGKTSAVMIRERLGDGVEISIFLFLTLMVGLRHEVGGDWGNYLEHYIFVSSTPLSIVLEKGESLYWLTMWMASYLDLGVHFANLIYSSIFCAGLVVFCKNQPRPWLALAISAPYLIIVIGMGYTRQSVALGLFMIALIEIQRQNMLRYIGLILLASLFHRTAALLLPFAVFVPTKRKFINAALIILFSFYIYQNVLASQVDLFLQNYVLARYQSDGALVRILMNLLPAIIFLILRKSMILSGIERKIWTTIAAVAIASTLWLYLSPSSTAVDRMALYLIPIQIYVFCRLPDVIGSKGARRGWVFMVIFMYAMIQFVWLNYSNYSLTNWVPYKFYPLVWIFD
jgi:hypothetical protein